jgi:hypothetical protein
MDLLRDIFGERIISKNAEFVWPPRSPDLTAPDFFLWCYLKERVYVNKPRTIQELKENIRAETDVYDLKPCVRSWKMLWKEPVFVSTKMVVI